MAVKKFNTKLNRLEKIAEALEGGAVDLEKSMSLFEEGMALVKDCEAELNAAEAKVVKLTANDEEIPFFKEEV